MATSRVLVAMGTIIGYPHIVEDGEVERCEMGAVADDVELRNFSIHKAEAKHSVEASARSDDNADFSVDQGHAGGACSLRIGERPASPEFGAARFGGNTGDGRGLIGADHHFGVEHRDQRVEVARAQSGQKCIDNPSLLGESRGRGQISAAHTPAGTAGKLPGRGRSAADDGGDFVEGQIEHVVEDKCEALGRRQAVEDHEQGQSYRVGEDSLVFGIGRLVGFGHGRGELLVERVFAAGVAGAQHVEADARDHGGQPSAKILNFAGSGAAKAQPRLLDRIVGLVQRAENAVGDATQVSAVLFELFRQPVALVSSHNASPRSVMVVTNEAR